jgi:hypothetical protein
MRTKYVKKHQLQDNKELQEWFSSIESRYKNNDKPNVNQANENDADTNIDTTTNDENDTDTDIIKSFKEKISNKLKDNPKLSTLRMMKTKFIKQNKLQDNQGFHEWFSTIEGQFNDDNEKKKVKQKRKR